VPAALSSSSRRIGHRSLSRWSPLRSRASRQSSRSAGQVRNELPTALTMTLPSAANLAGTPEGRTPVAALAVSLTEPASTRRAGLLPTGASAATCTRRNTAVLRPGASGLLAHLAPLPAGRHDQPSAIPTGRTGAPPPPAATATPLLVRPPDATCATLPTRPDRAEWVSGGAPASCRPSAGAGWVIGVTLSGRGVTTVTPGGSSMAV
jgi:hypothetical protein